ncbi:MAG: DUF2085 domain-containing protein [Pseudomonadales bacterium]|nr:DUF2085 domain-containing protein [Pseudomonadales bacterium]
MHKTKSPYPLHLVRYICLFFVISSLLPLLQLELFEDILHFICHRKENRSFTLGEIQLGLCARCMGLYIGAVVCPIIYLGFNSNRSLLRNTLISAVFVMVFFIEKGLEMTFSVDVGNTLRLFIGMGLGVFLFSMLELVWEYEF